MGSTHPDALERGLASAESRLQAFGRTWALVMLRPWAAGDLLIADDREGGGRYLGPRTATAIAGVVAFVLPLWGATGEGDSMIAEAIGNLAAAAGDPDTALVRKLLGASAVYLVLNALAWTAARFAPADHRARAHRVLLLACAVATLNLLIPLGFDRWQVLHDIAWRREHGGGIARVEALAMLLVLWPGLAAGLSVLPGPRRRYAIRRVVAAAIPGLAVLSAAIAVLGTESLLSPPPPSVRELVHAAWAGPVELRQGRLERDVTLLNAGPEPWPMQSLEACGLAGSLTKVVLSDCRPVALEGPFEAWLPAGEPVGLRATLPLETARRFGQGPILLCVHDAQSPGECFGGDVRIWPFHAEATLADVQQTLAELARAGRPQALREAARAVHDRGVEPARRFLNGESVRAEYEAGAQDAREALAGLEAAIRTQHPSSGRPSDEGRRLVEAHWTIANGLDRLWTKLETAPTGSTEPAPE